MLTVNIHEAKTNLSKLIDQAVASGDPFIIAKAGKPMVKVMAIDDKPPGENRRIGFMKGAADSPDNFNTSMADEIADMFSPDAP